MQATETEALVLKRGWVDAIQADVVVMSQACDLENGKVSNVIFMSSPFLSAYRKIGKKAMRASGQNLW
ncbi:hypothetical protein [Nostoc sp. C057]|uniref:hypothetical protein n=1 Tax=Nostoc sp. C057 TaxID=2576903 RepID=UPI001C4C1D79|nr:hypothetical protein [Nostoc sp. C057]